MRRMRRRKTFKQSFDVWKPYQFCLQISVRPHWQPRALESSLGEDPGGVAHGSSLWVSYLTLRRNNLGNYMVWYMNKNTLERDIALLNIRKYIGWHSVHKGQVSNIIGFLLTQGCCGIFVLLCSWSVGSDCYSTLLCVPYLYVLGTDSYFLTGSFSKVPRV